MIIPLMHEYSEIRESKDECLSPEEIMRVTHGKVTENTGSKVEIDNPAFKLLDSISAISSLYRSVSPLLYPPFYIHPVVRL